MNQFPEIEWRTADGLRIYARFWPTSVDVQPKANVIIVHGTGDHAGRFEWVAEQFNEEGFSVFAADWRGNGRSDGQRGFIPSFEVLLDDLEQTIEQAKEYSAAPVVLYGQSFGGLKVLKYAIQRKPKIAGAVISSPALRVAMKAPAWKLAIAKSLGVALPKLSLSTGIKTSQLSSDDAAIEAFEKDALRHRKMCAGTFFAMLQTGREVLGRAGELQIPTLVMHGDADTVTDHRASIELAEANPEFCELKIWPGMLHELHQDVKKEKVLQHVLCWLGNLETH
jgi:alpha-beta hydrolase superfamily lysophospholipase